ITGLKREKKITERTETEVKEEAEGVAAIRSDIKKIKDELLDVHEDMVDIKSEVDDIKVVTDGQKEI
ncbi:MAG: hypothetical protein Q7R78_00530, partial [bacterium]|nr:hypothetical protein [bacterium]